MAPRQSYSAVPSSLDRNPQFSKVRTGKIKAGIEKWTESYRVLKLKTETNVVGSRVFAFSTVRLIISMYLYQKDSFELSRMKIMERLGFCIWFMGVVLDRLRSVVTQP